ncbi:MAG TPA: phosphate/phosphite/phosphonate ABC transporter substrate-binding protein [Thermodesulfovibrionales bacterium]|nr:phosphate/phosphite/phosphonate ABC transporter substrate-binding protein [Thermodesulfovibrionales bacterium]
MKNTLTWKFIIPTMAIVMFATLVSVLIVSRYIREQIRERADDQITAKVEQVMEGLNATNTIELEKVRASMRVLMSEGLAVGTPALGESTTVGPETVQNLILGGKPQARNFGLVDHVKTLMGGTATLFVKRGDEFIRVSTNVIQEDGSRAVGTLLDPRGKAIAAVREGKAFYGEVDLLGKPYITGYEPMYDKHNSIIGVWYVGYPLSTFSQLGEIIADTKVLDNGFIALVDDRANVRFHSRHVSDKVVEGIAKGGAAGESDGWKVMRTSFNPWGFQVLAAYPTADIQNRIVKAMTVAALLGLAFAVFLVGSLFFLVNRIVILPLRTIGTAAAGISQGDLTFAVNVRGSDEMGRLCKSFQDSFWALGGILGRIKELSDKISRVSGNVEEEAKQVLHGAEVEAEAVTNIANSVEELNVTVTDIAGSTGNLAVSVEKSSASVEQMALSIDSVNRSISELSSAVDSTSSSINELSATIKEVASNARELAASSEETLSAISEITQTVKEVEISARESARLSEKVTSDAATFGMASIEKTIEGMKNIKVSVEHTAEFVKKLGGRSDEIGKILNVIDDVTEQTTLLALNAAILAAQAGEHGKGFSVVADEIKDLAERTAFSTKEIASLIETVQGEVQDTVDAMEKGSGSVEEGLSLSREAGDALKKILESSRRSSEMTRAIERSTTEQAKSAKVVTERMEHVRSMIDQIANATAEEARGIHLITEETERMRDATRQVSKASEEQRVSSKRIADATERVSDMSRQISKALSEHKAGTRQILEIVEGIKAIPSENRRVIFTTTNAIRELHKDSELLKTGLEHFRFSETGSEVFRLGVVALESPAVTFKKFSPLAEYLGRTLEKRVELKVGADLESAVRDLGENVTQMSCMGPLTYIKANEQYGVKVLLKILKDGKPYHRSVIITRADSTISAVKDLRGKTFAFCDMSSTTGHIIPRLMLRDAGIDIDGLQYYNYLRHHDDVARAVLAGRFDAGSVMESVAYKFKDEGLRFLQFSDEIPDMNVCFNQSIDGKDVSRIRTALLSLDESTASGAAILKSIDKRCTGFAAADDRDYDGVRGKLSALKTNEWKND